ncbi:MAG: metal-dependent hydrolase [Gordonia polyisoprenivorans]|nr:metal-dependent hydrolase [Gordonia polyisoprenivorans]
MTDLVVRKLPWTFDDHVPFQWQPANPMVGIFGNLFTFFAIPFETYIVRAHLMYKDSITDPAVAEEADAFVRQEGQHSTAHRRHMNTLIAQYPGLAETRDEVAELFEKLLRDKPVDFHVSYIANIEATFTPLFKVFLDHRETIFGGADPRIASLILWHFVEEIEHRSSGLIISDHVTPHRWTRSKYAVGTFKHLYEVVVAICEGFDRHVPEEDRGMSCVQTITSDMSGVEMLARMRPKAYARRTDLPAQAFYDVSSKEFVVMILRLIASQAPLHNPKDQPLPEWVDVWMADYERGADMTTYFRSPAPAAV